MKSRCISNIRQHWDLSQTTYADDSQGKFPFHDDLSPDYHRTVTTGGKSIVSLMRKTYVQNSWITICPITANGFGAHLAQLRGPFFLR